MDPQNDVISRFRSAGGCARNIRKAIPCTRFTRTVIQTLSPSLPLSSRSPVPSEEGDLAHVEDPSEEPEPEAKIDEAEDPSSYEETAPAEHAESQAAHEETPVHHDEAAEEKAYAEAVESSLSESHQPDKGRKG